MRRGWTKRRAAAQALPKGTVSRTLCSKRCEGKRGRLLWFCKADSLHEPVAEIRQEVKDGAGPGADMLGLHPPRTGWCAAKSLTLSAPQCSHL